MHEHLTIIERLQLLAMEADAPDFAQEAADLADRVRAGRFYVAILGQFKRGKSTLINALLGQQVLPVGVAPVTSVVTVVRQGPELAARVRSVDSDWQTVALADLPQYVSEAENPENRKGIVGVEVFCPAPMLEGGLCLVDTPGIGSVFQGNTTETQAFVPHVDAAVLVIGADPPLSGEELSLLQDIAVRVRHLMVLMSKADRLPDAERTEVRQFTERVLAERLGRPVPLFEVSATERLAHAGPPRDWPQVHAALEAWRCEAGVELVDAAARRGLERLRDLLLHDLHERRSALQQPVDVSERRIRDLQRCVADAERSLQDLRYLLQAEQDGLARQLRQEREAFATAALPLALQSFDRAFDTVTQLEGPALRAHAMEQARDIAHDAVDGWRGEAAAAEEARFARVSKRFAEHAEAFLSQLANSGEFPPDALAAPRMPDIALHPRERYVFHEFRRMQSGHWLASLLDRVLPQEAARRAIRRDVREFLEQLVDVNSHRVEGDLTERVLESRRRIEAQVREALDDVVRSAKRALQHAQVVRANGEAAVGAEVARLDGLARRVADVEV